MPKKWTGQNSKAAEANERKAAVKRDAQAEKERQKEDAKWADDDKHNAAKEARRKEAEEKRLKAVQRKAENKEIEQKERVLFVFISIPSQIDLGRINKTIRQQRCTKGYTSRDCKNERKRRKRKEES
eukprot:TRINITY_DN6056_c0_g1_i1.p1 TRINITY_DN6056_c0_g1~~TRINITY_DN6056_c0_g1_i1.p1  ORF type:complete len:127 (-),score=35.18 TRINITY_DN6056_c0_g1_i1:429-809(-)